MTDTPAMMHAKAQALAAQEAAGAELQYAQQVVRVLPLVAEGKLPWRHVVTKMVDGARREQIEECWLHRAPLLSMPGETWAALELPEVAGALQLLRGDQ